MLVCVVLSCLFLVALWSLAVKGLRSWLACLLCFVPFQICPGQHQNLGRGWHHETGLSPQVKYFTDSSKAVLLLWIFYAFLSCVCYAFVCLCFLCLVITCLERADLLALVCGV